MPYTIQLEEFSGPLELLLKLIQEEKLDITKIALADVADTYIAYLETLREDKTEELVDFLVIAAKLLLIKSRVLLPFVSDTEEEGISLEEQLRMYREFVEASVHIAQKFALHEVGFFREEPIKKIVRGLNAPKNLTPSLLHTTFVRIMEGLTYRIELPKKQLTRVLSIKERIATLQRLLLRGKTVQFRHFVQDAHSRMDIVVSFLALLELVKQRSIFLHQEKLFEDFSIEKV